MQMYSDRDQRARSYLSGTRMSMRHCVLAVFVGLVAILAFTTPSEAGPTIVTTTSFLFDPASISDLVVKYDIGAGSISNLHMVDAIPNDVTLSFNAITDTADVHYITPANATYGIVQQFSFEVTPPITATSVDVKVVDINYLRSDPGPIAPTSYNITFSNASVPEPGSMALLGIGMTSFIAFRLWIKRKRLPA